MNIPRKKITKAGILRQIAYQFLPTPIYVKLCYKIFSHAHIDLKNPQKLSEKWWWMMYYNRKYLRDLTIRVADKYDVQEYLKEKGLEKYLKKCYGLYENAGDIDFESLPNRFALKLTKSSGYNIICDNKAEMDNSAVVNALNKMVEQLDKKKWIYHDLAWMNDGKTRIVCEEYLQKKDGKEYLELNFFCFNGIPRLILVVNDYFAIDGAGTHDFPRNYYDTDWNPIPVKVSGCEIGYTIPKPPEYEEALMVAKKLSEDFLFVRVDLYVGDGRVVFSEITPAPAGITNYDPVSYDYEFGEMLQLPDVKVF